MTKVSPELGYEVQMPVSADVSFASNHFPAYKLGPDNQVLEEVKINTEGPSLKEVVVQETSLLSEQHKRLSVRDLASKFDKNLTAASKLSNETKLRDVVSLDGHVLLKKLRDALEYLKGRMAGQNKEDMEKAISMVEALAVKLTQKEGELIQEKYEVKKLASYLKQASEDAKKLVNQERSFACAEIESARAVVQRIGEALDEQEKISQTSGKQELKELMEEVQQARRIRLLHQPSKVMDMEHELRALRLQIQEKYTFSLKLQKQLAMSKWAEANKLSMYELTGSETLGSIIRVQPRSGVALELSKCSIQWYRLSSESNRRELISGIHEIISCRSGLISFRPKLMQKYSLEHFIFRLGKAYIGYRISNIPTFQDYRGANKSSYAPEPFDVGRILQVDITSNGQKAAVTTAGPVDPAAGVGTYVEMLSRKSNTEFSVVISQMNGRNYSSHSVHLFHVGKMRVKLCRGWITKARDSYSTSMQLCGFRGGGNSAAKSLFWQARKGQSFVLVFDSERDRNAAIVLARRYALDCNVVLAGPDDIASLYI